MSELRRGRCIEALVRSGVSCGLLLSVFRGCYFVCSEFRKRADLLLWTLHRWSWTSDALLLTRFRSKSALKWFLRSQIVSSSRDFWTGGTFATAAPSPTPLSLCVPAHAQTRPADHRTDAFTSVSSAIDAARSKREGMKVATSFPHIQNTPAHLWYRCIMIYVAYINSLSFQPTLI